MAEWMTSREEDLMSGDEEDSISGDEESERYEQYQPYQKSVSTSIPVTAQKIKLITEETLLQAQREDLRKVMDILFLKEQVARTLLIHYRWDFERLFLAFGERGTHWLYSQAGVANRQESTNSIVTICSGCTEEYLKKEDMTMMDCGHTFCSARWTHHFLIQIDEGQSKRIKCMAPELMSFVTNTLYES
jgi:ariadne-1